MQINTRLKINALLPVIGAIIIIAALIWSDHRQNNLRRQRETVREILVGVYDLYILTSYYLQYHDERLQEQWHIRHDSVLAITRQLNLQEERENLLVKQISHNLIDMQKLFTLMAATIDKGALLTRDRATTTMIERLSSQLVIRTRAITGDSVRLAAYVDEQVQRNRQKSLILIILFVLVLAVSIAKISLVLNRKITESLQVLQKGTEIIGSGNLAYRLELQPTDEIGLLGEAFNEMTESLNAITVSRDELAREVMERRQAEERLNQAMIELQRSNQELEQFAYVASHDLQEPLRMVASYVQLIARRYKGKLDASADEFISFAVDGANRMQRLINDLLAYSRVGTRSKQFKETDCNAVFKQAMDNLAAAINDKKGMVTSEPLPTIIADETQLVQLFQNLVANALKFTGERPPEVHVFARPQGDDWLFGVRDKGIGIDPQYAERIFMIFQRLHGRDEYPGTGIGLAICKKIVERHGGHIWMESIPGKGSTFYFTLPAKGADNAHG